MPAYQGSDSVRGAGGIVYGGRVLGSLPAPETPEEKYSRILQRVREYRQHLIWDNDRLACHRAPGGYDVWFYIFDPENHSVHMWSENDARFPQEWDSEETWTKFCDWCGVVVSAKLKELGHV